VLQGPRCNQSSKYEESEDQAGKGIQARDGKSTEGGDDLEDGELKKSWLDYFWFVCIGIWAEVFGVKRCLLEIVSSWNLALRRSMLSWRWRRRLSEKSGVNLGERIQGQVVP
jgi:hypothetical protein